MSKARAQTIQQRFGFQDGDLKTTKHDDIMLWLDQNIEMVALSLLPTKHNQEAISRHIAAADEFVNKHKIADWTGLGECPQFRVEIKTPRWEVPITTGRDNKYIVGFIDLAVRYSITEPYAMQEINYNPGPPVWRNSVSYESLFFEVKTTIPSLGELIRQIRMYQQYTDGKFIVVCPDDRFKEQLTNQGIGFVKYAPIQAQIELPGLPH